MRSSQDIRTEFRKNDRVKPRDGSRFISVGTEAEWGIITHFGILRRDFYGYVEINGGRKFICQKLSELEKDNTLHVTEEKPWR